MKYFDEIVKNLKISDVVKAMCQGLENMGARKSFKLDTETFGIVTDGICYGCIATLSVMELTNYDYAPEDYENRGLRCAYMHGNVYKLEAFEEAVDELRKGLPHYLIKFIYNYGNKENLAAYVNREDGRLSIKGGAFIGRYLKNFKFMVASNAQRLTPQLKKLYADLIRDNL